MHVTRIGLTPVKGGRHRTRASAQLDGGGPRGDRAFALVDPATSRCLRTIENPTLLRTSATWDQRVLTVELPSGTVAAEPVAGAAREVDYWGRRVSARVVDGPWAAAYAEHLGRDVELVAAAPGDVVYGASVTLVTTASLRWLAQVVGGEVDARRFRATVEVDTDEPHAEEAWVGRRVRIGTAEVRVRDAVPRCAVIDRHPVTGTPDTRLLAALAATRRERFGVDAEVVVPGQVNLGDPVTIPG